MTRPVFREAARVLVVGPGPSVLLFLVRRPGLPDVWAAPGGGVEPGEDVRTCARRELAEETGMAADPGLPVACTRELHEVRGVRYDCLDHVFVLRVPNQQVDTTGFTPEERRRMVAWRWWAADDVRPGAAAFFPRDLPALVNALADEAAATGR